MAKYVCTVCGYIAEGSIPEKCPVCGAASKAFKELTDLTLAAEHEQPFAKPVDRRIR